MSSLFIFAFIFSVMRAVSICAFQSVERSHFNVNRIDHNFIEKSRGLMVLYKAK